MKKALLYIILICLFLSACKGSVLTYPDEAGASDQSSSGSENEDTSDEDSTADIIWTSLAEEDWDIIWTGYGSVEFENGIVLEPKAATQEDETHSALVLSKNTINCPIQDFKVSVNVTTEEQLKTPTPYAWEVFWLFFNTTMEDDNTKETNYIILKPNGVELGTAYDEVGQTFLYTDSEPQLEIGEPNEIIIEKQGQVLDVTIDGEFVFSYDGNTEAEELFDQAGQIGLYTEDARVHIHSISIEPYDEIEGSCE